MKIDVAEAICMLVEGMLPPFSPKDKILLISIDARYLLQPTTVQDYLYLAFQRPTAYTKVFVLKSFKIDDVTFSVSLRPKYAELFRDEWKFIIDHDSCWRGGVERAVAEFESDLIGRAILKSPPTPDLCRVTFNVFQSPVLCEAMIDEIPQSNPRDRRMFGILFKGRYGDSTMVK